MYRLFIGVFTILLCPLATAGWQLDQQRSSVSFVSIKAGNIAETHQFTQLSGSVSADNIAHVDINTVSIDTLIPIRDDRMREFLFETDLFPVITVRAQLGEDAVTPGQHNINLTLTLKDQQIQVQAQVLVAQLGSDSMLVTSTKPVLLNASAVGLSSGVEKLRELAGLPSISQAVPVIFTLVYTQV